MLQENSIGYSQFYYWTNGGWQQGRLQHSRNYADHDLGNRIINGDIELVAQRYKALEVGGLSLRPIPND
jgi:hypothetical protein